MNPRDRATPENFGDIEHLRARLRRFMATMPVNSLTEADAEQVYHHVSRSAQLAQKTYHDLPLSLCDARRREFYHLLSREPEAVGLLIAWFAQQRAKTTKQQRARKAAVSLQAFMAEYEGNPLSDAELAAVAGAGVSSVDAREARRDVSKEQLRNRGKKI